MGEFILERLVFIVHVPVTGRHERKIYVMPIVLPLRYIKKS